MTKHNDWFSYYKDHKDVALSNILLHWQYLLDIVRSRPKRILEIGCGPADHSTILKKYYPSVKISLLDSDRKILEGLKKKYSELFENYYLCDLTSSQSVKNLKFKEDQFDVTISQGLLEHFPDKQFRDVINNCMPYTKKFIASIPSDTYPTRDYGNEILRNKQELEKVLSGIEGISYKIKKYNPDIGIRTKLLALKMKERSFLESLSLIVAGNCHFLIEIVKS